MAQQAVERLSEDEVRLLIKQLDKFEEPVVEDMFVLKRDVELTRTRYVIAVKDDEGITVLWLIREIEANNTTYESTVKYYTKKQVYGRASPEPAIQLAKRYLEARRRYEENLERFKRGEAGLRELELARSRLDQAANTIKHHTAEALATLKRHGIDIGVKVRGDGDGDACGRLREALEELLGRGGY